MKKLSLQWRITLMTALLIGATCIFMNVLIGYSGSHCMDSIGSYVTGYGDTDKGEPDFFDPEHEKLDRELTIVINGAQESFIATNWYITAAATLLGGVLAYFLSGHALKPLRTFTARVEKVQPNNLTDISKYSDNNKEKIKSIFDLIPAQLNDRNRRFTLSDIKNSARMLRYETSFNWLADAGVALPCYNITEPVLPLELNLQNNLFKLFLCDTGLLCAASMGNIQFDILSGDLSVNMGSILENVFAQELVSNGFLLRYFNKKNIGEIDFIVQKGKSAVPIEIKSGNDYTKHKALDNLIAKQSWNINSGIVFCKGNLEIENGITYYPWYMSMFFKQETLPEHLKVDVDIVNI